jgi:antitoxin MazE
MPRRETRSSQPSAHSLEIKVVPIGNSRGVRLPKPLLDKYAIQDAVVVEEREEGLLLRSKRDRRLSWEETFKAMAHEREDWSDLDATLNDGLDKEPW